MKLLKKPSSKNKLFIISLFLILFLVSSVSSEKVIANFILKNSEPKIERVYESYNKLNIDVSDVDGYQDIQSVKIMGYGDAKFERGKDKIAIFSYDKINEEFIDIEVKDNENKINDRLRIERDVIRLSVFDNLFIKLKLFFEQLIKNKDL